MTSNRLWRAYGEGSLAGVAVTGAFYLLARLGEQGVPALYTPILDDIYITALWGGLAALFYAGPLALPWWLKSGLLALVPAAAHLAHIFGWAYSGQWRDIHWQHFIRDDAFYVFAVWVLVWGLLTGYRLRDVGQK